ncbi:MAG: class I SAM-dependent methyltransferase [Bacteroidales bacterium]|nr:class I SAM-dependent methyltransferase [Bacteroidales bacterium]
MDQSYEQIYHKQEKEYWWFVERRKTIIMLIKEISRNSRILEVGCSSGVLLNELKKSGFASENLLGIDISEKAVEAVKKNVHCNSIVMDAQHLEFPDESFDIIIASDCLEHLESDENALNNWFNVLKKGGQLLVFVPAFKFLWSYHDEINKHFRRYTSKELQVKLQNAGFNLIKTGYWNFSLFFPTLMIRLINNIAFRIFKLKRHSKSGDLKSLNPFINKLLIKLLHTETVLLRYIRFPLGVSTFCVAKK